VMLRISCLDPCREWRTPLPLSIQSYPVMLRISCLDPCWEWRIPRPSVNAILPSDAPNLLFGSL
jgi:hypothetical protein